LFALPFELLPQEMTMRPVNLCAVLASVLTLTAASLAWQKVASSQDTTREKRNTARPVQPRPAEQPADDGQANAELRAGHNFIATPVYAHEQDQQMLKLFEGLRVADVSDGMDQVGLKNTGLVSSEIGPLWRDTKNYKHRFIGIAVTTRYVPTNRAPLAAAPSADFDRKVGEWYSKLSPEPFVPLLREGSALVIEDAADADVGSIGSNNIMSWKLRGCVGVVTSATARDTDEIITEQVPLYCKRPGRGIRPGRNEIESVNRPVVVGGALVVPGDVIVADGDGVIVVPRKHAEEVARYARETLEKDKAGRRTLYQKLGLPADASVK
jgi:regulator of RNase E activity RraA